MTHDLLKHDDFCPGWVACRCDQRLDDVRDYERDAAGRFSAGASADQAAEHAELAKAAAAGSSSSSAKSRARKAADSAALARVAAEHGDHAGAAEHAAAAQRHSEAAVQHGGHNEWTVRQRMSALREVDRAKATADPSAMAHAHSEAARVFGLTTTAGRAHAKEASRHASDVRAAERGGRIGLNSIAGDDSPKPPPVVTPPAKETLLDRLSRERPSNDQPRQSVFGADDDFGRRAADNARRQARDSVARERKAALDRQITAQYVTAKVVSLPSMHSIAPAPRRGLISRIGRALRGDELTVDAAACDTRAMSISRDVMRHDDGCPGDEGCKCEDSEDCDDGMECDEDEEECVEREDGAGELRSLMNSRYGTDLSQTPATEVVRRAATILRVDTSDMGETAASSAVTARARAMWRVDADREYERDAGGKFASTGAAADAAQGHAERGRAAASGTTPAARAFARKSEESAALARVAHEHGDLAGASKHAVDAERHADAAVMKSGSGSTMGVASAGLTDRSHQLMGEIAEGRNRLFAGDDRPPGFAQAERAGLVRRVAGTDRAELTNAGKSYLQSKKTATSAQHSVDNAKTQRVPPISNAEAAAAISARQATPPTPTQRSPGPTRASTAATTPMPMGNESTVAKEGEVDQQIASEHRAAMGRMGGPSQRPQTPNFSTPMPSSVKAIASDAIKAGDHSDEHLAEVIHSTPEQASDHARLASAKTGGEMAIQDRLLAHQSAMVAHDTATQLHRSSGAAGGKQKALDHEADSRFHKREASLVKNAIARPADLNSLPKFGRLRK